LSLSFPPPPFSPFALFRFLVSKYLQSFQWLRTPGFYVYFFFDLFFSVSAIHQVLGSLACPWFLCSSPSNRSLPRKLVSRFPVPARSVPPAPDFLWPICSLSSPFFGNLYHAECDFALDSRQKYPVAGLRIFSRSGFRSSLFPPKFRFKMPMVLRGLPASL